MALLDTFTARMKDAMKRKDARELALLRMVKSRFQLKLTEKGVVGPLSDEMAQAEIAAYAKQLQKSLPDFEKAGPRGAEKVEQIRWELGYLDQFLPKMEGEEATRKIVADTIAELGLTEPNEVGRLMGAIMKNYKGKVDPGLAKKLGSELLEK